MRQILRRCAGSNRRRARRVPSITPTSSPCTSGRRWLASFLTDLATSGPVQQLVAVGDATLQASAGITFFQSQQALAEGGTGTLRIQFVDANGVPVNGATVIGLIAPLSSDVTGAIINNRLGQSVLGANGRRNHAFSTLLFSADSCLRRVPTGSLRGVQARWSWVGPRGDG